MPCLFFSRFCQQLRQFHPTCCLRLLPECPLHPHPEYHLQIRTEYCLSFHTGYSQPERRAKALPNRSHPKSDSPSSQARTPSSERRQTTHPAIQICKRLSGSTYFSSRIFAFLASATRINRYSKSLLSLAAITSRIIPANRDNNPASMVKPHTIKVGKRGTSPVRR